MKQGGPEFFSSPVANWHGTGHFGTGKVSSFTGEKMRWMHSDHLPGMVPESNLSLCQALCAIVQGGLSYKHTRNLVSNVTVCGNAQTFDSSSLAADKARDSS